MPEGQEKKKPTPLSDEQMDKAVQQISFDLGVSMDQARTWAEEAQKKMLDDDGALVTRETVVIKTDTTHIDDEDVPAELVPRDHATKKWPGQDTIMSVVNSVKEKYQKTTH